VHASFIVRQMGHVKVTGDYLLEELAVKASRQATRSPAPLGDLTSPGFTVIRYNVSMFNIRRRSRKALTPLEQIIMDYLWAHANSTAEMCREGVSGQRALKDSTIRTILRNLEEKGFVAHEVEGRTFVYRALDTQRNVAVQAAQQIIDRFCGGSVEELLVGLVDNQLLEPRQLQRLAEKIASRKEKRA
jgi:BlaI family penicillinase repressor